MKRVSPRRLAIAAGLVAALVAPSTTTAAADTATFDASESVQATGYWMVDTTGYVYPFPAQLGSLGNSVGGGTAVKIAPQPDGGGYWILRSTGEVGAFGTADFFGHAAIEADEEATTMAPTPSGNGYWVFTNRGRVYAKGDAVDYGGLEDLALQGGVVDSVATPSGLGYYMVANDGGVFAFGDAKFAGSVPGILAPGVTLNQPVNGLVPDPDGFGYWLVAADGGVFAFNAGFAGSMGSTALNQPVIGMVAYGDAYLMVASDGGIFNFATDLAFQGSLGGETIPAPIASVSIIPPGENPTSRVSIATGGTEGNGNSDNPAISANGRYVAFRSTATNLAGVDNNGVATDIFRHDTETGETIRISAGANARSLDPAISSDGNIVVFASLASNLALPDEGAERDWDIFAHNVATGITTRVSVGVGGVEPTAGASESPSISADGRYVAFTSTASNLVAGDSNGHADIFVYDLSTQTMTRLTAGNGPSIEPAISPDGTFVAFSSTASDLTPDANGSVSDVFIAEIASGATTLMSVDAAGIAGNAASDQPDVSDGAAYVTFRSRASNLIAEDKNLALDVFVKTRSTGEVVLVSRDITGLSTNGPSYRPSISADGGTLAFYSTASDIVPADQDNTRDVFIFNRPTGSITLASPLLNPEIDATPSRHKASISADGTAVAYQSGAAGLVEDDTNGTVDVFRFATR